MGIALLALSNLFTPLHSLAQRWIMAPRSVGTRRSAAKSTLQTDLQYVQMHPAPRARGHHVAYSPARKSRPLRVVRIAEPRNAAGRRHMGSRVLLSGRMEDVCAELDRLAALEAGRWDAKAQTPCQAGVSRSGRSLPRCSGASQVSAPPAAPMP